MVRLAAAGLVLPGPFHIVKSGTEALDKLRPRIAGELRGAGRDGQASAIKGTRWALIKNSADLSPDQRGTLARLARDNGQHRDPRRAVAVEFAQQFAYPCLHLWRASD